MRISVQFAISFISSSWVGDVDLAIGENLVFVIDAYLELKGYPKIEWRRK